MKHTFSLEQSLSSNPSPTKKLNPNLPPIIIAKKKSSFPLDQSPSSLPVPLSTISQSTPIHPDTFSSNNTLLYYQGANHPTVYLSSFVRAKIISISNISYQQMSANLNCQIFIDISYRSVTQRQKNIMLETGIRLSFQKDQILILKRDNPQVFIYDNEAEKRLEFVIRRFIKAGIVCEGLFLSPFQIIKCEIIMRINGVKIQVEEEEDKIGVNSNLDIGGKGKKAQEFKAKESYMEFNFNMMDHPKIDAKLTSSIDSDFGIFQIASSLLQARYFTSFKQAVKKLQDQKNQKSKKKKNRKVNIQQKNQDELLLIKSKYGQQKLLAFNVANFIIPLFKKPAVANTTIFLPLLVLSLTNLSIFFCQPDLFKRIASIAAIMVSFVSLVPTIRQQIPPTSTITLVQILVFTQSLTAIIALAHSLSISNQPQTWMFDYANSGYFWASVILTVIVNFLVFVLTILYMCKWKPTYVKLQAVQIDQLKQDKKLQIMQWSNPRCDAYFKSFYQTNTIQILQDHEQKNYVFAQNMIEIGLLENNLKLNQIKEQEEEKSKIREMGKDGHKSEDSQINASISLLARKMWNK